MTRAKRLLIMSVACAWTFTFAKADPIIVDVPAGTIGCRLPPQLPPTSEGPPNGAAFYTGACTRLYGGPMNVTLSPAVQGNPIQLYKGQLVVCGATGCWVINGKLIDTWEK